MLDVDFEALFLRSVDLVFVTLYQWRMETVDERMPHVLLQARKTIEAEQYEVHGMSRDHLLQRVIRERFLLVSVTISA
jgi:hypothetical protein